MAIPSPPGQWPTRAVANPTSLVAEPPLSITIPANIKSGTAIKICLVMAPNETCIRVDHGKFSPQTAAMELPRPNTRKIGVPNISKIKDNKIANANISLSHC